MASPSVASMVTREINQPSYPQMIMEAIEALGENGGNKSTISRYIETTYNDLPLEHSTILRTHLNKMKESGELLFWKNNYMKFDLNIPPKRGRGRPPKPKALIPLGSTLSLPKPKGRPPKHSNAPLEPPKAKVSSGSGKPRGRPKKVAKTETTSIAPFSTGRPKGRPKKVVKTEMTSIAPSSAGRPRERPKKVAKTETTSIDSSSIRRPRGRPPKVKHN